jgi:hypothetical protein
VARALEEVDDAFLNAYTPTRRYISHRTAAHFHRDLPAKYMLFRGQDSRS